MLSLLWNTVIKVWIALYWKLIVAAFIVVLLIVLGIKFLGKGSFDDDPNLSPQEKMKSAVFWFLALLGSSFAGVLLYSWFD